MSHGHADVEQERVATVLWEKVKRGDATDDEILGLALLSLEPLHDVDAAVSLLEGVTTKSPVEYRPKVWLAFTYVYEVMTPAAFKKTLRLCEEVAITAEPADRAAALLLKATALREFSSPDVESLLRESIRLQPDWISNRQLLAQVYCERGDVARAEHELTQALQNASEQLRTSSDYEGVLFEQLITLRGSHGIAERLRRRLRSLRT